jgi:hypothetical protein
VLRSRATLATMRNQLPLSCDDVVNVATPMPSFVSTDTSPRPFSHSLVANRIAPDTRRDQAAAMMPCGCPGGHRRPRETLVPDRVHGEGCIPCGCRHGDDASPLVAHGPGDSESACWSRWHRGASKSFARLHTSPLSWLATPGQSVIQSTGVCRRACGHAGCDSTRAPACAPGPWSRECGWSCSSCDHRSFWPADRSARRSWPLR